MKNQEALIRRFAVPSPHTVEVHVGDTTLHVNKTILTDVSSVFRELLQMSTDGEADEADKEEAIITITDFEVLSIVRYFSMLDVRHYSPVERYSAEWIADVFAVAHKYDTQPILDACFDWAEKQCAAANDKDAVQAVVVEMDATMDGMHAWGDTVIRLLARYAMCSYRPEESAGRIQALPKPTLAAIMRVCGGNPKLVGSMFGLSNAYDFTRDRELRYNYHEKFWV